MLILLKFLSLEHQASLSDKQVTDISGEGRTLTPQLTSGISTYTDYSIGPDDRFDDNSVLSQQLPSSRTRPMNNPSASACDYQDQILKNLYQRNENKTYLKQKKKSGHEMMKTLTHLKIKLLNIKVKGP